MIVRNYYQYETKKYVMLTKNYKFMKLIFSIFLFFLIFITTNAQNQTGIIHGKILDQKNNPLPGASVIIVDSKYGVNANESGEYRFDQIPAGKIKVQASFVGYKTSTVDFDHSTRGKYSGSDFGDKRI